MIWFQAIWLLMIWFRNFIDSSQFNFGWFDLGWFDFGWFDLGWFDFGRFDFLWFDFGLLKTLAYLISSDLIPDFYWRRPIWLRMIWFRANFRNYRLWTSFILKLSLRPQLDFLGHAFRLVWWIFCACGYWWILQIRRKRWRSRGIL